MSSQIPLFDRVINFKLIKANGQYTEVICPKTGPKPTITLSGSYAGNIIYDATLKVMNLYTPSPLLGIDGSTYKYIEITVGYQDQLLAPISGQIFTAYQEKPAPDSTVVFQFIVGWFDQWMTTPFNHYYTTGTPISTILNAAVAAANVNLHAGASKVSVHSYLQDSDVTSCPYDFSTSLADAMYYLGRSEGIVVMPETKFTLAARYIGLKQSPSTTPPIELLFYNDVKKNAAGYTITAPFDPRVRPGDFIRILPKYFSSDFGGTLVKFGYTFYVLNVSFEFSTVGDTNRMILVTVAKD